MYSIERVPNYVMRMDEINAIKKSKPKYNVAIIIHFIGDGFFVISLYHSQFFLKYLSKKSCDIKMARIAHIKKIERVSINKLN